MFNSNEMLANPLLMTGLGLLSAGRDARIDPYEQAMKGLLTSGQYKTQLENEQKINAITEQIPGLLNEGKTQEAMGLLMSHPSTMNAGLGLYKNATANNTPSNVQEWKHYSSLPEEQKKQYLAMKRGGQFQKFGDVPMWHNPLTNRLEVLSVGGPNPSQDSAGGTPPIVPPQSNAQPENTLPSLPQVTPLQNAQNQINQAAADKAGMITGAQETTKNNVERDTPESQRENLVAQQALQSEIQEMERGIQRIDKMIAHPGRETATGKSSFLHPANMFAGTDASTYKELLSEIEGLNFMVQREKLKGSGTVTDFESDQAQKALANINSGLSDDAHLEQLQNLRGIYGDVIRRKYDILKSYQPKQDEWSIELVTE